MVCRWWSEVKSADVWPSTGPGDQSTASHALPAPFTGDTAGVDAAEDGKEYILRLGWSAGGGVKGDSTPMSKSLGKVLRLQSSSSSSALRTSNRPDCRCSE
eukprot:scaffold380280_cov31-Prasinocladus_malaysianus.AAC.1